MRTRRLTGCLGALAGLLSLSGCFMSDPGGGPVFGYRLAGGAVEVAYPICPGAEVVEVALHEDAGQGEGDVLWTASGPKSEAVERGVFTVNSPASFTTTAPAVELPTGVYINVTEHGEHGRQAYLDIPKARTFHPASPDSYFTTDGVMTRTQVNAQLSCNRPRPTT